MCKVIFPALAWEIILWHIITMIIILLCVTLKGSWNGRFEAMWEKNVSSDFFKISNIYWFDFNKQNIKFSEKFNIRKILAYLFITTFKSLSPTIQTGYFLLSKFFRQKNSTYNQYYKSNNLFKAQINFIKFCKKIIF